MGKPLTELIVPEAQRQQADTELTAAIEQGTKTDSLAQRCTQAGVLLDVLVYTAPLQGEQNKVAGAACIIRDISKLRAAERELKIKCRFRNPCRAAYRPGGAGAR